MNQKSKTSLLSPFTAIRLVWARTGAFSKDAPYSMLAATLAEAHQKDILEAARTDKDKDPQEFEYVNAAIATMDSGIRSLDIIYKGRELNFQENATLRETYLEAVKEAADFGNNFKDVMKSLPTMTIGSVSGIAFFETALGIKGDWLWGVGLIFAALSYLGNYYFVKSSRERRQHLYISQDYERDIYYEHYVERSESVLTSIYLDIERLHKKVFGQLYSEQERAEDIVKEILKGVGPTFCKYVHKHMRKNWITADLWTICETGDPEKTKSCKYWKLEKGRVT